MEKSLNLQSFKEKDVKKQTEMEEKLKAHKLENVLSLWYFVVSGSKGSVMGSKG